MTHRDRDERIEPVEVNRRQPNGLTSRLGESGIIGVVDPTVQNELFARQPQLLLARPVEVNDPFNGGHLLKQQRIVRAALVGGGGAGASSPTDLAFDFRQELFDPLGRCIRLFRLRLHQQIGGVTVHEPGLEPAVNDQQDHNKSDKGDDVLAEQSLPPASRRRFLHGNLPAATAVR